jgi:hypothetical protein
MSAADASATLRTTDLAGSRPAKPITTREGALHEIARIDSLRAQGISISPAGDAVYTEAKAFLARDTKTLLATVYDAVMECEPGKAEIETFQTAVRDAYANLSLAVEGLSKARKDDNAKRRTAKSAINAARNAGIPENELPALPHAARKMEDLLPGFGEGGWPSSYGRS